MRAAHRLNICLPRPPKWLKLMVMKLGDIFSNYFMVRGQLVETVKGLSQDQLDWTALNHPNSIGSLLLHIAETECWWVSCVALGRQDEVDEQKFSRGRPLEEILESLDSQHREFTEYLNSEDIDDWDEVFYEVKEHDFKLSKRALVWHVVEHQARHRGQIFMLMRMQGLEVPHV